LPGSASDTRHRAGESGRDTIREVGTVRLLLQKSYILAAVLSGLPLVAGGATGTSAPTDLAGNVVQLFNTSSSKTTVLIFVRTDCPISNRYAPELERLYKEFASSAAFYLVYADATNTVDVIRKHMSEYGYTFGALRDPGHELVKLARARVTPEAAVFSARGQLLYHGRIDNRYVDFGKAMPQPTKRDLEEALQSVLAGKPVGVASTPAIGCFLADVR
jgi:thiol-disulfide isomerase/thioredoxin